MLRFWTHKSPVSPHRDRLDAVYTFCESIFQQGSGSLDTGRLVKELAAHLNVDHISVYTRYDFDSMYERLGTTDEATLPSRFPADIAFDLTSLNDLEEVDRAWPLVMSQQQIGWMLTGPKANGRPWDATDEKVAEVLAQQTALFLLAFRQVRQLETVPQQLAQAKAEERAYFAQEIHDTTQQFLGRLPFVLSTTRGNLEADPKASAERLRQIELDVQREARNLNRIRRQLDESWTQIGLAAGLNRLFERVQVEAGLILCVEGMDLVDEQVSRAYWHTVYRVVQQALDNVIAHAHAEQVDIRFGLSDGKFTFTIEDDGVGIAPARIYAAQKAGRFGIRSMKSRMETAGGVLEIHPGPFGGTRVVGTLTG